MGLLTGAFWSIFYFLVTPILLCIVIGIFRECWNGSALQRKFQQTALAKFKEHQTQQFVKKRFGQEVLPPRGGYRNLELDETQPHVDRKEYYSTKQDSFDGETGSLWNFEDYAEKHVEIQHPQKQFSKGTPSTTLGFSVNNSGEENERNVTLGKRVENNNEQSNISVQPSRRGVVQRVSKIWQEKANKGPIAENRVDSTTHGNKNIESRVGPEKSDPAVQKERKAFERFNSAENTQHKRNNLTTLNGNRALDKKPSKVRHLFATRTGNGFPLAVGLIGLATVTILLLGTVYSCFETSILCQPTKATSMNVQDIFGEILKTKRVFNAYIAVCIETVKKSKVHSDSGFCAAIRAKRIPIILAITKAFSVLVCSFDGTTRSLMATHHPSAVFEFIKTSGKWNKSILLPKHILHSMNFEGYVVIILVFLAFAAPKIKRVFLHSNRNKANQRDDLRSRIIGAQQKPRCTSVDTVEDLTKEIGEAFPNALGNFERQLSEDVRADLAQCYSNLVEKKSSNKVEETNSEMKFENVKEIHVPEDTAKLLLRGFSSPEAMQAFEENSLAISNASDCEDASITQFKFQKRNPNESRFNDRKRFKTIKRKNDLIVKAVATGLNVKDSDLEKLRETLKAVVFDLEKTRATNA